MVNGASGPVHVIRTDGGRVELTHAHVEGDTLRGEAASGAVAIPVAAVQSVSVRRLDKGRSIGLGLGIAGAATVAAAIASSGGGSGAGY